MELASSLINNNGNNDAVGKRDNDADGDADGRRQASAHLIWLHLPNGVRLSVSFSLFIFSLSVSLLVCWLPSLCAKTTAPSRLAASGF